MNKISILGICIIALVAFAAWAPVAEAYPVYQTANGALDNCSECHPGFDTFGGPLHSAHTAYITGCNPCHPGAGGTLPVSLSSSGSTPGLGCSGCHGGGGLQLHHINAGAPADSSGLTCDACHPGATSPPESTPPGYYGTAITSIENPCQATPAPPGEDFDGSGQGLDNDGDTLYDMDDPDCAAPPECTVDADCDDGVGCTVDTCDVVNGLCVYTPDDASCDDGTVCTGIETCDPVNDCQPGTPLICDDMNLCTTDSCDAVTGCLYTPVECLPGELCDPADGMCKEVGCMSDDQCDDGMFCNGAETCDVASGNCMAGTPPNCDDGIGCTVDTCDEVNDTCVNTPDDTICDDGDVCTGIETCDPVNDCQPGTPLICDDMNLCTTDSCDTVTGCLYTPVECLPGELCDPADGMCKEVGCTSDDQCDDGMFCNGAETCDVASGMCAPGTPPNCDDGIDCTVDTCDEVNDMCANTPDDTACPDDGMFCTGQEICDPAAGCISTGDPCPEGMTCNEDTDTCDMVGHGRTVTICHKARTMIIPAKAVPAHLGHGDFLGPCPE